jgi:Amino acid kinase family
MALSVDSLARSQFTACQRQFIYFIPSSNAKNEFRFSPNPNFRRRGALVVSSNGGVLNSVADKKRESRNVSEKKEDTDLKNELTVVMKFGGSSLATADRMKEVAVLITSFPEERPIVVLSAMGKTTNKLLAVKFFYIFVHSFV